MSGPSFRSDEFLEVLSRIKRDQPRRYAREVSAGQQVRVTKYEELRAEHGRRPARAAQGREANEQREEKARTRPATGRPARLKHAGASCLSRRPVPTGRGGY